MGVAFTMQLLAYLAGVWVNILEDTAPGFAMSGHYGIDGNSPADCLAGVGQLQFWLRNDASVSGRVQGYYSPQHANCRTGWTYGTKLKLVITYNGTDYTKFYGKVQDVLPDPGRYGAQLVQVTAYDVIYDLLEANARQVTLQVNKTEAQLVTAILDALATDAQPPARDIDSGVDTFPWAFDRLDSDTTAAPLLRDVILSASGMGFSKGDGTFVYRNRHSRAVVTSSASFGDSTLREFLAPSSTDKCLNLLRVTQHPKSISAAATEELYTLPTGSSLQIDPGQTLTIWCDYTDPNDRQTAVGGTSVVTVLVGGTHYAANSSADGLGANVTADVSATLTAFASTGKYALQNTSSATLYITLLKVIGKAVRDLGAQTFEAASTQPYGQHALSLDLPYQNDALVAQSMATYLERQYRNLADQVDEIGFVANDSAALMVQALAREPSDMIDVSETVTGLADVSVIIYRVEFEIADGNVMTLRWGLAPAAPFAAWQLGLVGASELGSTTTLGF